ncbi:MAG: TrpR-like protein YerC/YecD [Clostridia bacterium]|nr:TrpR-like protein YerC/YecD [Clostridia bacterium]
MEQSSKIQSKEAEDLFEAVLALETIDECYRFFEDLCTVKEIKAMAQRFEVARMLLEKKTYSKIEEETSASTATISRINRTLQYGTGGYEEIIAKTKAGN